MAKVTYKNKDESVEISDGSSFKQVIRDNSWNIPFGCEEGICGTCIVRIVSGMENLSEVSEKERQTLKAMELDEKEFRLVCQLQILNGEVEFETL